MLEPRDQVVGDVDWAGHTHEQASGSIIVGCSDFRGRRKADWLLVKAAIGST